MHPRPFHRSARALLLTVALLIVGAAVGAACGTSVAPWGEPVKPFSKEALNFLVVGDWGRNGFFGQDDVADQMGETAARIHSQFVVSTGDNFYPSGVGSIEDGQFRRSFTNIYTHEALQTPWYLVLGNHDYRGNVDAQIEYTEFNLRWNMPDRYFAQTFEVDDSTSALFLFLDTQMLKDGLLGNLDGDVTEEMALAQLAWIDRTLEASDAEWRVAVSHHPVYTASVKHGDAEFLKEHLVPLLEARGAQVMISGHAHNLQHLKPEGPIDYFISGAGSMTRKVEPTDDTQFAAQVKGFMAASLTHDRLHVRFIDEDGRTVYATTVLRPQRAFARVAPAP